ncbi:MAG TPA: hypothetical protein VGO47_00590, partial [Chlamydiales bacterium]|nr:hypothetical protein [Chlamydiales bacterium]
MIPPDSSTVTRLHAINEVIAQKSNLWDPKGYFKKGYTLAEIKTEVASVVIKDSDKQALKHELRILYNHVHRFPDSDEKSMTLRTIVKLSNQLLTSSTPVASDPIPKINFIIENSEALDDDQLEYFVNELIDQINDLALLDDKRGQLIRLEHKLRKENKPDLADKLAQTANKSLVLPMDLINLISSFVPEKERPILREVCRRFATADAIQSAKFTEEIAFAAVRHGSLSLFSWALPRLSASNMAKLGPKICAEAAREGRLEILQWARANGCPWDESTCANAARNGYLEILQWARANSCPWDKGTCADAAQGHLEVLKWARANGGPWDEMTCSQAALSGHLEVLQWARANGCPWDTNTCSQAARGGHLEVLQWARANDCPWYVMTCADAARGGHLEVLQWARANGCPWNAMTCVDAAQGGHLEILQWARA